MTLVVLDSKGEIERLTTGKAPERPEIAAANAKRADAEKNNGKQSADASGNGKTAASDSNGGTGKAGKQGADAKAAENPTNADDIEGEDGLTPREKREFTASMLRSLARKHEKQLDAEAFAADQYNQRRLAETRAENLERQLEELRKQAPQKAAEPPKELIRPKRESFETQEAYEDALLAHGRALDRQEREKAEREAAEQREQERRAEVIRVANERLQRAAELVPDFQAVTEAADLRVPGHIAGYMQESDMFAELGYHFAQHPDIMEKLAKLSPAKALVEVGKIESTLKPFSKGGAATASEKASDGHEPSSKTESASPAAANGKGAGPTQTESTQSGAGPSQKSRAPVIRPLGSDSVSQVEKNPGEMSTREVIEAWKAKNRANLGLRKRH